MSFKNSNPEWIWGECSSNGYFDIVHDFDISNNDSDRNDDCYGEIYIDISVDSQYILLVNGELAAFGQFADYPSHKVYDTIAITKFISKSLVNRLCILAYYNGENSSTYIKGDAGITFEVYSNSKTISLCSSNTLIRKSTDYKSGIMEKISPQLSFTCYYDASKYDDWNNIDYIADSSWNLPDILKGRGQLFPRPVKKTTLEPIAEARIISQGIFINSAQAFIEENASQIIYESVASRMQCAFLSFRESSDLCLLESPVIIPFKEGIEYSSKKYANSDGIYLMIDLSKEDTGHLTLDIETISGTVIDISYGEHLDDLRVRSFVGGRNFAVQYTAKSGRQQWTDLIRRIGCRYIQVHFHCNDFKLYYIGIKPSYYPVILKPKYLIDDKLHSKIQEVSIQTLKLCMHEHYEDCPWREQALYSMDSRNQMLCGYFCFDNLDFAKASISLLAQSQQPDGLIGLCAPADVPITIPSFSLTFIIQLYEYLFYANDLDFGKTMFPVAQKILEAFSTRLTSSGLIPCFIETAYWNFYEWADGLDGGDIFRNNLKPITYDAPLNGFLSIAYNSFSLYSKILGYEDISTKYETMHLLLNKAINEHFWDANRNVYADFISEDFVFLNNYSELTQSLLVYCNAAKGLRKEAVLNLLASNTSNLIPVTLSFSIFKYDALMTEEQKYHVFVFSDIARIWGNMLFAGATTFWETEKGAWDFNRGGSLCHGWSAIPVYFYSKYNF